MAVVVIDMGGCTFCGWTGCSEPGILDPVGFGPLDGIAQGPIRKGEHLVLVFPMQTYVWYPWGDSNARARLRRPLLYPLSYRGILSL